MRSKYVGPVHLPADVYRLLEQTARQSERNPLQQARWILRQALTTPEPVAGRAPEPVSASTAGEARL